MRISRLSIAALLVAAGVPIPAQAQLQAHLSRSPPDTSRRLIEGTTEDVDLEREKKRGQTPQPLDALVRGGDDHAGSPCVEFPMATSPGSYDGKVGANTLVDKSVGSPFDLAPAMMPLKISDSGVSRITTTKQASPRTGL